MYMTLTKKDKDDCFSIIKWISILLIFTICMWDMEWCSKVESCCFFESGASLGEFMNYLQQIGDAFRRLLIEFVLLLLVIHDQASSRLVQSTKHLSIQDPKS